MTKPKRKAEAPLIGKEPVSDEERRHRAAMQYTGPQLLGANLQANLLADSITRSDLDLSDMYAAVGERATAVTDGNLTGLERRLAIQANSLDTLFNRLADRATMNFGQNHLDAVEKYMRLALKAQAQCRATIETIHLMHNPTQIIRQTNIAQGHQQVVNGTQGGAGKIESVKSKLLDAPQQSMTAEGLKHDLDSRKAAATV